VASALKRAWQVTCWRLVALAGTALAVGLLSGHLPACLLVATVLALGWMLYRLQQLSRAVAGHRHAPAAEGNGIWDTLLALLQRQQRRSSDEKLRLAHRLRAFRDAAEALPDAVLALDREQRIEWFNPAASKLLGLTRPEAMGAHLADLVRTPNFAEWLRDGAAELLIDLPSSENADLQLSLHRIRYADQRSLLVVRDVSRLMRLEQVRRDFVANVSHELRTPLTVVHGYLDMIEPEQMPEYESILRELRNQSRRMTQIVEDLLTLSRLESGQEPVRERVAMGPMLDTLRREAEALTQGSHTITVEQAADFDLLGSTRDLHSAFSNLVTNAVRYTPAGGCVTLRWEDRENEPRLSVTDTGHGIPAQHLPRLTERFYRVSNSRSRESGGTGLGLSIVKHVLQLHQARLEIESEVGVGSTFACVFDAKRRLEPAEPSRPVP
jgi:two-component system phosphate regulon sensor histidine kinase PhoR